MTMKRIIAADAPVLRGQKTFKFRTSTGLLALSAIAVSGCSSTIFKKDDLGSFDLLSIDAKQRLVLTGTRYDGRRVICTEPSPDALVATASYAASSFSNADDTNISAAAGTAEAVSSLGVRTQTIQLLRDGYFRICEAYLNGAIGNEEYRQVISAMDTFMVTLVAIQAMGGVVVAPPSNISVSSSSETTLTGATTEDGSPSTAAEGNTTAATGLNANDAAAFQAAMSMTETLTDAQVAGIRDVVLLFLKQRPRPKPPHTHIYK